jgi:hypothetical protein
MSPQILKTKGAFFGENAGEKYEMLKMVFSFFQDGH